MARDTPGIAYRFWQRLETVRVDKGWTKSELAERSGQRRATIDNLRTSTRAPQPRIVDALADALGIDRGEARQLAGLPVSTSHARERDPVRIAIAQSTRYSEAQRRMLYNLIDVIDEANQGSAKRDDDRSQKAG